MLWAPRQSGSSWADPREALRIRLVSPRQIKILVERGAATGGAARGRYVEQKEKKTQEEKGEQYATVKQRKRETDLSTPPLVYL